MDIWSLKKPSEKFWMCPQILNFYVEENPLELRDRTAPCVEEVIT
jgi:hypothetical protein